MPFERNSRKVLKNTMFLYGRMFVLMLINFYTSKLFLEELGVTDFGISNIVGGIIILLSFLSNSMTLSVDRYLAFEMGLDANEKLSTIFSTAINIHFLIAVFVIILGETIGLWFVNTQLVIPYNRMTAANWIYQSSIISFIFVIIRIPFVSFIIAKEHMKIYSYLGIIEGVGKLLIAISLLFITIDHLIAYGILITLSTVIVTILYIIYCIINFKECRYQRPHDSKLFKDMASYAGISTFGNLSSAILDQGQNIILNIFFGPIVNAARAISYQVNTAINSFVSNIYTAVTPQITKSFAANDTIYLETIVRQSSIFSLMTLIYFIVPVICELPSLLVLWLGNNIPENTIIFCRLILINLFLINIGKPLLITIQSSNKIFKIHLYSSIVSIMNIPVDYLLLKYSGLPAFSVFIIQIVFDLIYLLILFYLSKIQLNWNISSYIYKIVLPYLSLFVSSIIIVSSIQLVFIESYLRLFLSCTLSVIYTSIICYFIILPKDYKKTINFEVVSRLSNIKYYFKRKS